MVISKKDTLPKSLIISAGGKCNRQDRRLTNDVENINFEDSKFGDATQLISIEDTIEELQDNNATFLKASWENMFDHIEKLDTFEDGFS